VAVLDAAHIGDIRGALGTIKRDDTGIRHGLPAKLKTLLAIVGPGLIVMVGDNDAGAFGTYTQAGQNYGTRLLWTLLLLVPVLYVNQEMVLRLGAVTGVGHGQARSSTWLMISNPGSSTQIGRPHPIGALIRRCRSRGVVVTPAASIPHTVAGSVGCPLRTRIAPT
jgi:hypothetical protein